MHGLPVRHWVVQGLVSFREYIPGHTFVQCGKGQTNALSGPGLNHHRDGGPRHCSPAPTISYHWPHFL